MSRSSFSEARTGKKAFKGNGNKNEILAQLPYEPGEAKRIVVPIIDGSVAVFSTPIHKVLNDNVRLPKKVGTYPVSEIRCTHVATQTTDKDSLEVAKRGETCLYCDIARLESRKQWAIINEKYGDEFKELSKEEKKAIFQDIQKGFTVDNAFINDRDEEGNTTLSFTKKSYLLVLELDASTDGKKLNLDGNGKPKVTPRLLSFTPTRINKIKEAVENAIDSEAISHDSLTPYIDNEGTQLEEEVLIGWVDFTFKFPPRKLKMESAKDLIINVTSKSNTVIDEEGLFIESMQPTLDKYLKDAEFTTTKFFKNLANVNREVALEYIADREDEDGNVISGEEYVKELEDAYARKETIVKDDGTEIPSDEEKAKQSFANTIERLEKKETETAKEEVAEKVATPKVEEEVEEEEVKAKPVRKVVKKRPVEKVVEEDAFDDSEFDF